MPPNGRIWNQTEVITTFVPLPKKYKIPSMIKLAKKVVKASQKSSQNKRERLEILTVSKSQLFSNCRQVSEL